MDLLAELSLSAGAIEKLRQFQQLVEKWTPHINLVARSTVSEIWSRHILDSARIGLLPLPPARRWVDLGAGGGFPGIVMAVILADRGATTEMILVESDARKATFLREASRLLGLAVTVHTARAEALPPQAAEIVSARALAPLDSLCGLAVRHLAPGGTCVFPKGERAEEEVAEARKSWRFDLEAVANPDHKGSALLVIGNLRRA